MKNNLTGKAEVLIQVPASKVWQALTQPDLIKRYFFGADVHTEWKVGGPIVFSGEYKGKKYKDKGTILAFEPRSLIRYSHWSPLSGIEDKVENYALVTYRLKPIDNNATELTITQENIPDEKTREHSVSNWKKVLFDLKTLLEESSQAAAY